MKRGLPASEPGELDYLEPLADYEDPQVAGVFDELSFWSAPFGALLFRNLDLAPGLRVLDIGCGNGFPLFELAHTLGPSCRAAGLDLWRAALARAARKREIYRLERVWLLHADGARLPLSNASFDLIVSNLGINNFADPPAVLAECARVARPPARLVLTTNVQGHMQEFYRVFREILEELGQPRYLERLAANEAHRRDRASLQELLLTAGFRPTQIVEDSFELRYLNGSAFFRHSLTRYGFLDGWRAVVDPPVERQVFAEIERRLNDIARRQGELRMTIPMLYLEAAI